MKYLFISLQVVIIIFSLFSVSYAQHWIKFFSNELGYDFFYSDNIVATNENNIFLTMHRTVPQKQTESDSWIELTEVIKVDCSLRMFKRLEGRRKFKSKPVQRLRESAWTDFEPFEFDSEFYKTVCRQQRSKS